MDFSLFGVHFIKAGGITLIVLSICSAVSWIAVVERLLYFKMNAPNPLNTVHAFIQKKSKTAVKGIPSDSRAEKNEREKTPMEYVLHECFTVPLRNQSDGNRYEETKNRAIAECLPGMERFLGVQAALGTVSPYIGLLGTIFGIIRAFSSLSVGNVPGSAGSTALNTGIAEALVATASGLVVAIPATIAYNYFRQRLQAMVRDMEIAAAYLKEHLLHQVK